MQHHLRHVGVGECQASYECITVGHSSARCTTSGAVISQYRPSQALTQPKHRVRILHTATSHDHAAPPQLGSDEQRSLFPPHGDHVPWRTLIPSLRKRPRSARQWVPEAEVEVHRAPTTRPSHCLRHTARTEGTPRRRGGILGHPRLAEPAHRVGVQLRLIHGLGGTDIPQFRGSVSGTYDERHTRQVGLDDGGAEVGGGGATGTQQHRGHLGGHCVTECRK